jgi:DNA repair protein RAD50
MAALNKLAIRGIRSFDDKQIAVIEFYSPVTVIVGHNGSGKTVRALQLLPNSSRHLMLL